MVKGLENLTFIPVLKPYAHTLYILRQCAGIVYINGSKLSNMKYNLAKESCVYNIFKNHKKPLFNVLGFSRGEIILYDIFVLSLV